MLRNARGFTLIELTVALVVASLVLLTVHALASALFDAAGRTRETGRALAGTENARRVLVQVFGSVQAGVSPGDGFIGDTAQVACTSWYLDSRGLPARYRVTLAARSHALVLDGLEAPLTLADSVTGVTLEYLVSLGASSTWVRGWSSPVGAPLAMRVRMQRAAPVRMDTLLVLIGERG